MIYSTDKLRNLMRVYFQHFHNYSSQHLVNVSESVQKHADKLIDQMKSDKKGSAFRRDAGLMHCSW